MKNNREQAMMWWNGLPTYDEDRPCKRILSNIYYEREPSYLNGSEIEHIWKKTVK